MGNNCELAEKEHEKNYAQIAAKMITAHEDRRRRKIFDSQQDMVRTIPAVRGISEMRHRQEPQSLSMNLESQAQVIRFQQAESESIAQSEVRKYEPPKKFCLQIITSVVCTPHKLLVQPKDQKEQYCIGTKQQKKNMAASKSLAGSVSVQAERKVRGKRVLLQLENSRITPYQQSSILVNFTEKSILTVGFKPAVGIKTRYIQLNEGSVFIAGLTVFQVMQINEDTLSLAGLSNGKSIQNWVEKGNQFVVGWGRDCDWSIADRALSKKHFAIEHKSEGWIARDFDSLNGLFQMQRKAVIQWGDQWMYNFTVFQFTPIKPLSL